MLVYTFNGFCSALAGLAFCLFVFSGHGLYAPGFELDVIASVVMGGTMLTGGSGYVFGTFFGVLVLGCYPGVDPVYRLAQFLVDKNCHRRADPHFYRRTNRFGKSEKQAKLRQAAPDRSGCPPQTTTACSWAWRSLLCWRLLG